MSDSAEIRRIPPWLAILIVALFLGAAGWFLWTQAGGDKKDDAVVVSSGNNTSVPVGPGGRRGFGRTGPAGPTRGGGFGFPGFFGDGVRQMSDGEWRARSGDVDLYVTPQAPGEPTYRAVYRDDRLLMDDAVRKVLEVRYWIASSPGAGEAMNLTAQQVQQLRAIGGGGMTLSDADRAKIKELWQAWQKADGDAKREAEKTLLSALADMGKSNLEATKQSYAARAERVKTVLTPAQIDEASQKRWAVRAPASMPGSGGAGPTTVGSADGAREVRSGEWRVKGGIGGLTVSRQTDGSWSFGFRDYELWSSAPRELSSAVSYYLRDEAVAKAAGLTDAQIAALKGAGGMPGLAVSKEEEERLKGLWAAFQAAVGSARADAEKALVAALTQIGQKNHPASKQALDQWAATIRANLTDQQVQIAVRAMNTRRGPGGGFAPTTRRPATTTAPG